MVACRRKRHDGVDLGRWGIGMGNIGSGTSGTSGGGRC